MTVVFQSNFLPLQLKAPVDSSSACSILNIKVRAWSCTTEVCLKDRNLTYHNWSSLTGDEPRSTSPLYPGGVNLLLKIPWEEDERERLPITAGVQEAKTLSSTACLHGKKKLLFSVLLECGNTPLLKERYCLWYKHQSDSLGDIKLKIKMKNKLLNYISEALAMREETSNETHKFQNSQDID